jgi:hypothetical protein
MDYQVLFNLVVTILMGMGGYLWKTQAQKVSDIEQEQHKQHADALTRFAHKDETLRMLDDIKSMLRDISYKIDTKQDKHS